MSTWFTYTKWNNYFENLQVEWLDLSVFQEKSLHLLEELISNITISVTYEPQKMKTYS